MIWELLFISLITLNLFFMCVVVYNYFTAPRIKNTDPVVGTDLKISVLIPARNEEYNIKACLESVLEQSYKNIEVIVLDDHSIDKTASIVNDFESKDKRVRIEKGRDLPEGWLGKNWACFQLAKKASGDLFLFIDADVRLSRHSVSNGVGLFLGKHLNLLSVFPTQKISGIGAQLVVPLMNWILLTFLPLIKVYSSANKSFVAANGQFILIDSKTYEETGGHSAVRDQVVEDMELARRIKRRNLRMMTALGDDSVSCQMYNSFKDSINGFSKNFFSGFNTNIFVFASLLFFIFVLFFSPLLLVAAGPEFLVVVSIILIGRIIISKMSRQNVLINSILHFIQIPVLLFIGFNSVHQSIFGRRTWKGRKI
ncbi:MAG TPA: glycosyltransferase family 2 protein [Melioribacteraceae bacterium]|nr:glycosyltransferase family 2 protein [Melioribacteraceae bacterium]